MGANPFMMGYGGQPGAGAPWFGGVGGAAGGSAAAFHAPGAKNEIKLFVGGLQFQTQGTRQPSFKLL